MKGDETATQEQRIATAKAASSLNGTQPLLSVRELRLAVEKGESSFEPVTGATLNAKRGEVVGVVGESGSGKSLTLRAIAGLLPAGVKFRSGEVKVDGIDVANASGSELRRLHGDVVGMIFQEPMSALNPTMRIGAQIAESARAHRDLSRSEAKRRSIELLSRMGFSRSRAPLPPLSPRTLGRHAAAGDDRHCPGGRTLVAALRRADHRTRRDGDDERAIRRLTRRQAAQRDARVAKTTSTTVNRDGDEVAE